MFNQKGRSKMRGVILLGAAMLLTFSSCRQYETCATYAKNTKAKQIKTEDATVAKL